MSDNIKTQAKIAISELIEISGIKSGEILVIGCSSSEIMGGDIGKASSIDAAKAVFDGIYPVLKEKGIYASGVQVHIRTASLKVKEFSRSFHDSTNCSVTLAQKGFELFKENYTFGEPLRSVGLRAINIKAEKGAGQISIFDSDGQGIKIEQVDDSLYNLRQKFGNESLKRGRNI